jgi:AAA+ superfamily predicted ATPase
MQLPLIFRRAEKWNAVLLLDEADVFLEQRSCHDVHRNALVSVFLRELEYYQGIMFLTTNRVKHIDDAIASRVHLPLRYKSLNLDDRRGIWKGFLEKAVTKEGRASYSRKDLERLAEKDINGRQVGFPTERSKRLVY